jgi:5-hydroxyisourate hydrolase-like protein (transthyretin family)
MGVPAHGLPLALLKRDEHSKLFEVISSGVTNEDGRVGNLLPPSNYLPPAR